MNYYTWTHQCGRTSTNLHRSVLWRHWVPSRGLTKSDGRQGVKGIRAVSMLKWWYIYIYICLFQKAFFSSMKRIQILYSMKWADMDGMPSQWKVKQYNKYFVKCRLFFFFFYPHTYHTSVSVVIWLMKFWTNSLECQYELQLAIIRVQKYVFWSITNTDMQVYIYIYIYIYIYTHYI